MLTPIFHIAAGVSAGLGIGIGGGLEKADAIRAVLKGNWITTLVTDAGVARKLIEQFGVRVQLPVAAIVGRGAAPRFRMVRV